MLRRMWKSFIKVCCDLIDCFYLNCCYGGFSEVFVASDRITEQSKNSIKLALNVAGAGIKPERKCSLKCINAFRWYIFIRVRMTFSNEKINNILDISLQNGCRKLFYHL